MGLWNPNGKTADHRIWQLQVTLRDGSRCIAGEFHGTKEHAHIWFDNQTNNENNWREPLLLLV